MLKLNPNCTFLWQRPKSNVPEEAAIWYDNMVVGKNTLGQLMQIISKEAQLSTFYTNHSIRATCITMLDECGYESRHIIGISKHKSESSLKHYSSKLSEKKKRDISDSLCEMVNPSRACSESGVKIPRIAQTDNQENTSCMSAVAQHNDSTDYLDMLTDMDDEDLAAILDDPKIFGTCNSVPKQSMVPIKTAPVTQQIAFKQHQNQSAMPMMFNIRGCNVTINYSNTG